MPSTIPSSFCALSDAVSDTTLDAYNKAFECDPTSIFGGIVAFNKEVDAVTAEKLVEIFLEIVIAPGFTAEALEVLKKKKNLRSRITTATRNAAITNGKTPKVCA